MCHKWLGPLVIYCLHFSLRLVLNSTSSGSRIFNNSRTFSLPTTSRWSLTNRWVICLYTMLQPLPLSCSSRAWTIWRFFFVRVLWLLKSFLTVWGLSRCNDWIQETIRSLYTPAQDDNSFELSHDVKRVFLRCRNVVCKSDTIACGRFQIKC